MLRFKSTGGGKVGTSKSSSRTIAATTTTTTTSSSLGVYNLRPFSVSSSFETHHLRVPYPFGKGTVPASFSGFKSKRSFSTLPEREIIDAEQVDAVLKEQPQEKLIGTAKKHDFQAETRKILDIVVRSLYTDREVFVRELISNASDALEKFRHETVTGKANLDPSETLEIKLQTDAKTKTLIIQDNGIGMTEKELITNLGRIGHSGSAEFLKNLSASKDSRGIIGQFGVGFYSAFMVGSKITVYSKSFAPDAKGYCWVSDGAGSYEIFEAEGVARGTKIVISLNSESTQFAEEEEIESIIKKYSNFVGFPIKLNDKQVNTIKALWTLPGNQITEKDHSEFFKFISHSFTDPLMHMHYTVDSPVSIRALFYVGQQNQEKFGMGKSEHGVNLFSRKVLIQAKAKALLPEYLRFVKGVVDSEDIPLNISREFLQDSNLIRRIKGVLTKRILKFFDDESKKDPKKYATFFAEFGAYLKEGIISDFGSKEDLAKLFRFESSKTEPGTMTSLDDYIARMPTEQKEIYYLCAPSRSVAEQSPYFEVFKAQDKEVLFLYSPLDDFVMTNSLLEYKDKKIVSAEASQVNLKKETQEEKLTADEVNNLLKWMKNALEAKVSSIKATNRLVESPAIIVGHDTTAYRRMMKYVDPANSPALPKQQLEINPNHPLIVKLYNSISSKPKLSAVIALQIYDNALVAAGLVDDARVMVTRMNSILGSALDSTGDLEEPSSENKQ